jgi:uncharacterized membrane protein YphA (DoxX/SURF4 family)
MIGARTIAGHSLPFNILFVVLNLCGLALTTIAFHDSFADHRTLLASIGIGVLLLSVAGLIFLKGRLMIATVSRVIVGGLFIVSGLIKANDPVGFAYKLEEYFEDGALAFRIKEWFGAPGFSLEFLVEWALVLSVIICILEIVLGVLVLIGGKIRLSSWLLLLMMLFFTFLTWHTANCDPKIKFTDRDTYAMTDPRANLKLDESKTNKDIRIISKTSNEITVDELRSPQCVLDCGCFGDAMKGSVGRSLTPKESLWKDIVLLYLVIWIFAARRIITPNTVRQNWAIVPVTLVLIAFFCWVFSWYFPLLFGGVVLITSLWIYRSGGKLLGNHWGAALMAAFWCSFFVWYVLNYDPLKDYRPYAVGSNLYAKTLNGRPGKYVSMMIYRNVKTGKTREYDAASQAFLQSKIWENPDWKYDTMINTEVRASVLPSIDTNQFNPSLPYAEITQYERKLKYVADQLGSTKMTGLRLRDTTGVTTDIPQIEYNIESYPAEAYTVVDTITMDNPDMPDISVRDLILKGDKVLVVVSKKLSDMNKEIIPELIRLQKEAEQAGVPLVFITNADAAAIKAFRKKYGFAAPTFTNDEIELKVISRSNPCLMVVQKGVVAGKYTHRSMPDFNWIQKNLFLSTKKN